MALVSSSAILFITNKQLVGESKIITALKIPYFMRFLYFKIVNTHKIPTAF